MKQKLKNFGALVSVAGAFLFWQGVSAEYFSDEIKNSADLIKIVKEEGPLARKDSLTRHIYWKFGQTPWGTAASAKLSEGNYVIILDGSRTRTAVRHELYHIYDRHCDNAFAKGDWTTIDKMFNEITANCYAYYGWRL